MTKKRGARGPRPAPPSLPTSPFQAFLSLVWDTPWRVPIILVLSACALFLFLPKEPMSRLSGLAETMYKAIWPKPPQAAPQPFPAEPKVVAIEPDSEFGTLHFTGLEQGLLYDDGLSLVRLSAPIADMKHGNVGRLTEDLARILSRHDVVAVVGPGITECTRDVLQTVDEGGDPIVVFVNSAAPRYLLETDKGTTPVFRINSGIDERAERLAQLTKRLLEEKIPVLYLVEQNPDSGRKSFGQELDSQIRRKLDLDPYLKSGQFQRTMFPSEKIEDLAGDLGVEFGKEQVIFLLGLGHDYKTLVNEFYAASNPATGPRANLVGVMAAYALDDLFTSHRYLFSHLFEITDVELGTNPQGMDTPDSFLAFLKHFKLQRMNPAHRDEAFAFDAGLSLATAWKAVKDAHALDARMSYGTALSTFAGAVQNLRLRGASGPVAFRKESLGNGYQNLGTVGTQLTLCSYRPELGDWKEVPPESLSRFAKMPPPASARLQH